MVIFHSYVSLPEGIWNLYAGGFNHLEKYEFVNGKDDIPYYIYIHIYMVGSFNSSEKYERQLGL